MVLILETSMMTCKQVGTNRNASALAHWWAEQVVTEGWVTWGACLVGVVEAPDVAEVVGEKEAQGAAREEVMVAVDLQGHGAAWSTSKTASTVVQAARTVTHRRPHHGLECMSSCHRSTVNDSATPACSF